MANTKSSIKSIRKIATRTERNTRVRSRLKTLAKKARLAASGEDADAARQAARDYISALDRAAKSKVIHKNKADRGKAAFAKVVS